MLTILISWTISLGGAFALRYLVLKKPLSMAQAIGVSILLFASAALFTLSQPQRQHAGMLLAAFIAYFVLRRGSSGKETYQETIDANEADGDGTTPLIMAAMLGKVREIRGLLAAGAVVNAVDERGWSPLMHAATKNEFEAIEVLLKAGADPSLTNSDGLTALDLAIKTKCLDAAEFLQQHRLN